MYNLTKDAKVCWAMGIYFLVCRSVCTYFFFLEKFVWIDNWRTDERGPYLSQINTDKTASFS